MRSHASIKLILTVILALTSATANAATDSVSRDPKTGDWIFTVTNPETNQQKIWRYEPTNQFTTRLHDSVRWDGTQFSYKYKLSNSPRSKQAIAYIWIDNAGMSMSDAPDSDNFDPTKYANDGQLFSAVSGQMRLKDAYIAKYIGSPKDWRGRISISNGVGSEFGWFAHPNVLTSDLAPGQTLKGAIVLRPELPGIGYASMQGATEERGRAAGLPAAGPLAEAWEQIEADDVVQIPVMVPAIAIPQPYNGAELAKRIKTHVATWLKLGLITQDTLDRLNRSFDALIAAQTYNNIAGTHAAVREILQEAYSHHRGLTHHKHEEDDDEHDAEPVKRKAPAAVPLNRVAARALSFDLTYLLTRAYIGK